MKRILIPRADFEREFAKHAQKQGYGNLRNMFERELKVEPVRNIIAVEGGGLRDFKEMLRALRYATNPKLVGKRGEDAIAVKDYGDLILDYRCIIYDYNDLNLGQLKGLRRHLKIWDLSNKLNHIFTTAHNEDAPSVLLVEPFSTLYYHLFTKGMGDYESGTRDFYKELDRFF